MQSMLLPAHQELPETLQIGWRRGDELWFDAGGARLPPPPEGGLGGI